MRSGFDGLTWEGEYYTNSLDAIRDFSFVQREFATGPGLVSRSDGSGWKSAAPFTGQAYDASKFDVVDGAWDHDHCYVCEFRLDDGYSYWQNGDGVIVCDTCKDYIMTTYAVRQRA